MKKIGILFGMEDTFPWALIERINAKGEGITAEKMHVSHTIGGKETDYDVVLDRISQDVPYYRSMLKNAALMGTYIVNNPFWWSADDKFFNYALTEKIGIPTPKTILLPSYERPADTTERSFRNLAMLDWEEIFGYIGFPAFLKPHAGGGWKNVYKITNAEEFFNAYHDTGRLVMTLQEGIEFESYYRCYGIGTEHVRIMPYEPRNPHHLRYLEKPIDSDPALFELMTKYVKEINLNLGYEFNTVEFAVKDGIPYAIDFGNPAPDADKNSVGEENFEWVVETAANFLIEKVRLNKEKEGKQTWGSYLTSTISPRKIL